MFIANDFYTTSGPLKLYHCWTDKVTKFDSSSFYNWEQDDLPIYDLEERTFYLWEQLGYPTSAMQPAALVVSADAPDSLVKCNKNIFRSVSAAVEALPQNITFPIIIEIANFGDIGELKLANYKFGPRGSLEIINRNFSRPESYINGSTGGSDVDCQVTLDTTLPYTRYNYSRLASGIVGTALGASITGGPMIHFKESSCVSISAAVFSSTFDSRLSGNYPAGTLNPTLNGYISYPKGLVTDSNYAATLNRGTLIIAGHNNVNPYTFTNSRELNYKAYEYSPQANEEIDLFDVSTLNLFNNQHLNYQGHSVAAGLANGLFYGNKTSRIIVDNCNGPIFIRNFFLDGSGYTANESYGVQITNSPKIYLENIVATRFRKAGFFFENSDVTLLRGCVGIRNYNFGDSGSYLGRRLTSPWLYKIKDGSLAQNAGLTTKKPEDLGAGLLANNSNITVSSTSALEYPLQANKFLSYLTGKTLNDVYGQWGDGLGNIHMQYTFDFTRNANGIILNNSTLTGGYSVYERRRQIYLNVDNNTGYGIKSNNSKISFDGGLISTENMIGISCDSSQLEVDRLLVGLNQSKGLELNNSIFKYNKNTFLPVETGGTNDKALLFSGNAQHLTLNNSKMLPVTCSSMDKRYGVMKFTDPIGVGTTVNSTNIGIPPAIHIKNGSEAVILHPHITRTVSQSIIDEPVRGSEVCVENNSKAVLKGTGSYATRIIGPNDYDYQKKMAAVYANNNSIVEINGPTFIGQYGIDLLGENNSNILIRPHTNPETGLLDISGYTLSSNLNHTAVELHSTRACVVVKNKSNFIARDLGSYIRSWSKTDGRNSLGLSAIASGINYNIATGGLDIEPYVSAGFLQFYPNPNDRNDYKSAGASGVDNLLSKTGIVFNEQFSDSPAFNRLIYLNINNYEFQNATLGGTCVRAVNDSLVEVQNVNFPCGWWNPSSIWYDSSATGANKLCNLLFIWNIADTSQLRGSLFSVSSHFPGAVPYWGPSGEWGVSAWPNSTPDTSSISILDYFGKSDNSPYRKTSQQNYGPFRLYFSVNPGVNILTDITTSTVGAISQIYAQGYHPSSSLKALAEANSASSLFTNMMLTPSLYSQYAISGWYYGSAIMESPGINAYLDESAAESFANAKHCSVGKSGMAKKVSINLPYTNISIGDCATNANKALGRGYKSSNSFDLEKDN